MLNKSFQYDNKEIRTFIIEEEIWFCGKDVAKILGYKDESDALKKHVESDDKSTLNDLITHFKGSNESVKFNKRDLTMIYINGSGLTKLLCKSRLPNKCDFINWCNKNFNINIENKSFLAKEQDTIGSIIRVFDNEKYQTQFEIGNYRIDLYFTDKKIAIGCDENDHKDRDKNYEIERHNFIVKQLQCKYIRYNPDAKDFDIFKVIKQIMLEIYQ